MDRSFLIQLKGEMNQRFIELTNNLYRLTLLFPKKEPLRYKMRELAVDILAKPNEKNLEVLDSFFEVALVQNWVSPSDILAIKKEYDNLRETLKKDKSEKALPAGRQEKKKDNPVAGGIYNSDRKVRIMEFLKENGRAQVWQIKEILPEVSKRTLRRDFERMLEQGLIQRVGEKNDTFYKIKTV